ncbi:MAG: GIY-YIG nuclease family protein [Gammaproteobacteria bacterium]|nr:GIY-YIG nuclease family protein [Gammaproteobacteria bacterium]
MPISALAKLPVQLAESLGETKHVYIISHPKYPGEYKVGIAKNMKARLNAYQASAPNRAYKLEFSHETRLFRETEKHIHTTFDNKHESVSGEIVATRRRVWVQTER